MKRITHASILCSVAFAGLALVPLAGAKPSGTTCTDTLQPGAYNRVVVPDDAVCIIDTPGTVVVNGGLTIGAGATFVLGAEDTPDVRGVINGGVHATNAASVQIHFSTINGGIDVQGGAGPFGGLST